MMHVMTGAIPVTAGFGTVPDRILLSTQRTALVALVLLQAELLEQRRLRRSRLRVVPAGLINAALIRVIVVAVKAGRLTASGGQTRQYARNKQHDPVHHSVPGCRRDRARRFRPVTRFCERFSSEIPAFAEAGLPVHRPPGPLDFTGYDGRTGFGSGAGCDPGRFRLRRITEKRCVLAAGFSGETQKISVPVRERGAPAEPQGRLGCGLAPRMFRAQILSVIRISPHRVCH